MTKTELETAVNARLNQIETALELLPDEQVVEVTTLFPVWVAETEYPLDYRAQYNDKLYKCVQAHISQADWTPDATPALWTEVAKPGEIPVWKQPAGAQDAYMTGDKVWYPEKDTTVYVSTVDNNVWMPTVYGWAEA